MATTALVAVGDKPARRTRNATSTATPPAPTDATSATPTAPADTSDATAQLAAKLVVSKATRQPVEIVEAILAAHDNGDPLNRIAAAVGGAPQRR